MSKLCECGCGRMTSIIPPRSHDPVRGVIAGQPRRFASRSCYHKWLSSTQVRNVCPRGHSKTGSRMHRGERIRICIICSRAHRMARRYGLDFEEVLNHPPQDKCESCGFKPDGSPWNVLVIDHDHQTLKIRGWLCAPCNKGIGLFEDNPGLLRAAIKYLEDRGYVES